MAFPRGRNGRLILLFLLTALVIRLATVRFGLPALNDPDELMFEVGALHMLRGGTLDPGWFGHPATTAMYALALIDAGVLAFALLTGRAASVRQFGGMVYADPSWIILPGRIAAVLVAVGVIWLTWRLAARLFGPRAGLVAAALLALDPVHVTWSQIIRADMVACLFTLLCLNACVDIAERGRRRDYARAALWLGLAIASKWPFALAALAIAGASVTAIMAGVLPRRRALGRLAASGAGAVGVLLVCSPYLLIRYATAIRDLRGEGQAYHLGATGGGFWYNLWWYSHGALLGGFGIVGLLLLALGAATLPRHRRALAVLAPVGVAFILLLSFQSLIWERWALPLLPIGAIVAGLGLERLGELLRGRLSPPAARATVAAVLVAALVPLGLQCRGDGRARMNDTRQLASAWARRHVPRGSSMLVEHYAFDIADDGWRLFFPIGDAGCVDALALVHGRANPAAIEQARNGRSNVDYGTMAPSTRAACRPDFAILAQMDRYRAERKRFPREYAAYVALAATGRVAARFGPEPGAVGGPVVTILDLRQALKRGGPPFPL